jgi:hypothetical protein
MSPRFSSVRRFWRGGAHDSCSRDNGKIYHSRTIAEAGFSGCRTRCRTLHAKGADFLNLQPVATPLRGTRSPLRNIRLFHQRGQGGANHLRNFHLRDFQSFQGTPVAPHAHDFYTSTRFVRAYRAQRNTVIVKKVASFDYRREIPH